MPKIAQLLGDPADFGTYTFNPVMKTVQWSALGEFKLSVPWRKGS